MERSDTHEELPKREEVVGEEVADRMMRMVLSLRAELYDLYAKHQALLDENARLKATKIVTLKLKEEAQEVTLPTTERPPTPCPATPKFPLQPAEFRPLSPSEHGLTECPPNVESTNP
jgi:hypothetical protein